MVFHIALLPRCEVLALFSCKPVIIVFPWVPKLFSMYGASDER